MKSLFLNRKDFFALSCVVTIALIIEWLFLKSIFPDKYFYDSNQINDLMKAGVGFSFQADSFTNTAAMLRYFFVNPDVASFAGFFAVVVVMNLLVLPKGVRRVSIEYAGLFFTCEALMVVYLGQTSKELLALLLVAYLLAFRLNVKNIVFLMAGVAFYALFFRQYWLIFLSMLIASQFFHGNKKILARWILIAIGFYAILSVLMEYFMHVSLLYGRNYVNDIRVSGTATSDMETIIPSGIYDGSGFWADMINAIYTFFILVFPVPLLKSTSFFYWIIFLFYICLYSMFLRGVKDFCSTGNFKQRDKFFAEVIFFYVATQVLFEPDYGSYLRHFTPFMPVLLSFIASVDKKFFDGESYA